MSERVSGRATGMVENLTNAKQLMKMKFAPAALLATLIAGTVMAGPLAKENVDQNAKWLVHIDLDQLRAGKLGQFLIQELIVKQAEMASQKANNILTNVDVAKVLGQLHSLTAYGTDFHSGPDFDG